MAAPADFRNALALSQQAAQDGGTQMFSAFESFVSRVEGIMASQAKVIETLGKQNADLRATITQNQTTAEAEKKALRGEIIALTKRVEGTEKNLVTADRQIRELEHAVIYHGHMTNCSATSGPAYVHYPNVYRHVANDPNQPNLHCCDLSTTTWPGLGDKK